MFDSFLDGELVGGIILPSDICSLLLVNMNKDSNKDRREASINEILEQLRMWNFVKSFGTVHKDCVHNRTIPDIVIYSFVYNP